MMTSLSSIRLPLFPHTAQIVDNALCIADMRLADLAEEYGTPLYVFDRLTMDATVQRYKDILAASYPGESGLTYAGKAFLCTAIAQWTQAHDLRLDCTGSGELAIAAAASVKRSNVLVHGVNKSQADLQAALAGAGVIVVDHLAELRRLAGLQSLQGSQAPAPQIWLRLRPGLAVKTHAYTQTGQEDSKFGMGPAEFMEALYWGLQSGLPINGLHFHQGSHFHDPAPLGPALETALDLVAEARASLGWLPESLCPGGGWGVPYHEDDLPHQPLEGYVRYIAERLVSGCQQRGLPLPRLQLEPGRSLVAQAGVAIYRVQSVKRSPQRRWLLLDGGMADNPRPALYGARYSALPLAGPDRPEVGPAWLAGPYCESGDILIQDLPMPDVQPGEYVAVPVSGAYQLSMGSNYNGARKPAVLWLEDGHAQLIQRRETLEDLFRRDYPLRT
jgi:diaminopimelate decarboxylase